MWKGREICCTFWLGLWLYFSLPGVTKDINCKNQKPPSRKPLSRQRIQGTRGIFLVRLAHSAPHTTAKQGTCLIHLLRHLRRRGRQRLQLREQRDLLLIERIRRRTVLRLVISPVGHHRHRPLRHQHHRHLRHRNHHSNHSLSLHPIYSGRTRMYHPFLHF